MENLKLERFIRIDKIEDLFQIFWGILEKFVRFEKKIKNLNQLESYNENEIFVPP